MKKFHRGEKVILLSDNGKRRVYDFGYYSQSEGMCVLYQEGERNMQDSFATEITDVQKLTEYDAEVSVNKLMKWIESK